MTLNVIIIEYFLLINLISKVSTQAVIDVDPINVTVTLGMTVTMQCNVQHFTDVYWEVHTRTRAFIYQAVIQNQRQKNASRFSSRFTWTWNHWSSNKFDLIISSVEKNDQGLYTCHARGSDNRHTATKPAQLNVKAPGDNLYKKSPENVFAVAGTTARFECSLHSEHHISWIFIPTTLASSKFVGTKLNKGRYGWIVLEPGRFSWDKDMGETTNSDLIISKVNKSDEGLYECRFNTEGIVYRHGANLTIIELPDPSHFTQPRTDLTPEASVPLELTCNVSHITGHFLVDGVEKIAWLDQDLNVLIYDGLKLTTNTKISVNLFQRTKMSFSEITYEDSQSYYCVFLSKYPSALWYEFLIHVKGCPPSGNIYWKEEEDLGKCYGTLKDSTKTFGEAEVWCRKQGGHLAMPKSSAENQALQSLSLGYQYFWIGLTQFEHGALWNWLDGSQLRRDQMRWSWTPKHPKSVGRLKDCAKMFRKGVWEDLDCDKRIHFVCETPNSDWMRNKKLQDSRCPKDWIYFDCGRLCYNSILSKLNWSQAKSQCSSWNAKLAMPKTARGHRFVKNILMHIPGTLVQREVWIGLVWTGYKYFTNFEWMDGMVENWIFWGHSRSRLGYNCLTMNSEGRINARKCSDIKYFVCQKPQKVQQDVRSSTTVCGEIALPSRPGPDNRNVRSSDSDSDTFILRGAPIAIEDAPWSVRIHMKFTQGWYTCGGALISHRLVLTAAHCLVDPYDNNNILTPDRLRVSLGSEDKQIMSGTHERVYYVAIHHRYAGYTRPGHNILYDVAVLELKRSLQTDCWKIRAVCLQKDPDFRPPFSDYDECFVAGWGHVRYALQHCTFTSKDFSRDAATRYWYRLVGEFRIARGPQRCSGIEGDSGSGLVCRKHNQWKLAGVLVASTNKNKDNLYISPQINMKWLEEIIQANASSENRLYIVQACKWKDIDISCDYGRPPAIQIEWAYWGRIHYNICPGPNSTADRTKLPCHNDVKDMFRKRCDRRNHCTFDTEYSTVDHDQCKGRKTRYHRFAYKCIHSPYLKAHSCGTTALISCGLENQLNIQVESATWEKTTADHPCDLQNHDDLVCSGAVVTDKVAERCNGKVTCQIEVTHDYLGLVCPLHRKYFQATYQCLDDKTYEADSTKTISDRSRASEFSVKSTQLIRMILLILFSSYVTTSFCK